MFVHSDGQISCEEDTNITEILRSVTGEPCLTSLFLFFSLLFFFKVLFN